MMINLKNKRKKENTISKTTHKILLNFCYARLDSLRNAFINSIFFLSLVVVVGFFCFAQVSSAATEVYLENNTKDISMGDTFVVDLKISSLKKSINVVDGIVTYDKDKLKIEKVSKDDSILSLWTIEPTFDNNKGELSFSGGIPNGFDAENGKILEITFLAKNGGKTLISFNDIFSVFLNNGKGTKIGPWLKPLSVDIASKSVLERIFNERVIESMGYKYLLVFILILLFIIIKVFIKLKNKNRAK